MFNLLSAILLDRTILDWTSKSMANKRCHCNQIKCLPIICTLSLSLVAMVASRISRPVYTYESPYFCAVRLTNSRRLSKKMILHISRHILITSHPFSVHQNLHLQNKNQFILIFINILMLRLWNGSLVLSCSDTETLYQTATLKSMLQAYQM